MGRRKKLSKIIQQYSTAQSQQPGLEKEMYPRPEEKNIAYKGSKKLQNKVAIITGGDSGIGHAVAMCYAAEGADMVVAYLNEHDDAKKVQEEVKAMGRQCELFAGDLSQEKICRDVVKYAIKKFGKIDILVNNVAIQFPQKSIVDISSKQLLKTFSTNIFSYFYMAREVVPYLKKGGVIINTSSVTCYKGSAELLDYSATKGAIVAFTRSLSLSLIKQGIRVNGVAPGPVWTPLIPASFDKEKIKNFGKDVPMKRIGQPDEIAACYVFLAAEDSSYMSGQFLHPNGGVIVNG